MMRIVSFGQVVDLEHGVQLTNQLTLELSDGRRAVVTTNDETVQQLIGLASGTTRKNQFLEPTPRAPEPEEDVQVPMEEAELAGIFGGEDDPGEMRAEPPEAPRIAESPTPPSTPMGGLGTGPAVPVRPRVDKDGFLLPVHARTVEKDEMGYPVVRKRVADAPPEEEDDGSQI